MLIIAIAVGIAIYTRFLITSTPANKELIALKQLLLHKADAIIFVGTFAEACLGLRFIVRNVDLARIFIGVLILTFALSYFYFAVNNLIVWRGGWRK